jgi:hypothetical protein
MLFSKAGKMRYYMTISRILNVYFEKNKSLIRNLVHINGGGEEGYPTG